VVGDRREKAVGRDTSISRERKAAGRGDERGGHKKGRKISRGLVSRERVLQLPLVIEYITQEWGDRGSYGSSAPHISEKGRGVATGKKSENLDGVPLARNKGKFPRPIQ